MAFVLSTQILDLRIRFFGDMCRSSVKFEEGGEDHYAPKRVRLTPKAAEVLAERSNGIPIWVRAPKRGLEFYTGLSKAKLYELAALGKIRSVSLREPGQIKGTRLFNLASILGYIEAVESTAASMN